MHSGRGAFWNFPNSGPEHWHRDGQLPLLLDAVISEMGGMGASQDGRTTDGALGELVYFLMQS